MSQGVKALLDLHPVSLMVLQNWGIGEKLKNLEISRFSNFDVNPGMSSEATTPQNEYITHLMQANIFKNFLQDDAV